VAPELAAPDDAGVCAHIQEEAKTQKTDMAARMFDRTRRKTRMQTFTESRGRDPERVRLRHLSVCCLSAICGRCAPEPIL